MCGAYNEKNGTGGIKNWSRNRNKPVHVFEGPFEELLSERSATVAYRGALGRPRPGLRPLWPPPLIEGASPPLLMAPETESSAEVMVVLAIIVSAVDIASAVRGTLVEELSSGSPSGPSKLLF